MNRFRRNSFRFLLVIGSAGLMLSCAGKPPSTPVDPLEDSDRQRAMVDAIAAAIGEQAS